MLGQKRSVKFLPVKVVGKGVERKLSHRQIYGLPPSVFQNKDSPDYKPNYGKKFTERQLKILNEEIPIEEVRLTEISIIMRKAESLGDEENLDIARMLYAFKTHKEEYQFNISAEDAKRTLQDLTPWEIDCPFSRVHFIMIFQRFGNMKFAYRNREFWCRGYYVDTAGKNTAAIKAYIQNQLKTDKETDQLSLFDPRDPFTGSK